jgi:hypothetical protein
MTEKLRKEKDSLEGQLNPLVNKFNQHKQGIEIKKQELASIENKSQKNSQNKALFTNSSEC